MVEILKVRLLSRLEIWWLGSMACGKFFRERGGWTAWFWMKFHDLMEFGKLGVFVYRLHKTAPFW